MEGGAGALRIMQRAHCSHKYVVNVNQFNDFD